MKRDACEFGRLRLFGPPFTLQELGAVLRDLHYGKAADADGMVVEIFKYRGQSQPVSNKGVF